MKGVCGGARETWRWENNFSKYQWDKAPNSTIYNH